LDALPTIGTGSIIQKKTELLEASLSSGKKIVISPKTALKACLARFGLELRLEYFGLLRRLYFMFVNNITCWNIPTFFGKLEAAKPMANRRTSGFLPK